MKDQKKLARRWQSTSDPELPAQGALIRSVTKAGPRSSSPRSDIASRRCATRT